MSRTLGAALPGAGPRMFDMAESDHVRRIPAAGPRSPVVRAIFCFLSASAKSLISSLARFLTRRDGSASASLLIVARRFGCLATFVASRLESESALTRRRRLSLTTAFVCVDSRSKSRRKKDDWLASLMHRFGESRSICRVSLSQRKYSYGRGASFV